MDNVVGALVIFGLIIAAVAWVIQMVFAFLAGTFVVMTGLFGHPNFVIAALAAVGAGIGMFKLDRSQGGFVARSEDDYAKIGSLRLTPEQWSALVLFGFIAALALYGLVFISGRAHRLAETAVQAPTAFFASV